MDYVDAARSRGVREFRLVSKHATKPALIPIITVIGLQIALLLGGAVLTETTVRVGGPRLPAGALRLDLARLRRRAGGIARAAGGHRRRYTNFIVDIIAAIIDPRIRY